MRAIKKPARSGPEFSLFSVSIQNLMLLTHCEKTTTRNDIDLNVSCTAKLQQKIISKPNNVLKHLNILILIFFRKVLHGKRFYIPGNEFMFHSDFADLAENSQNS